MWRYDNVITFITAQQDCTNLQGFFFFLAKSTNLKVSRPCCVVYFCSKEQLCENKLLLDILPRL